MQVSALVPLLHESAFDEVLWALGCVYSLLANAKSASIIDVEHSVA